MKLKAKISWLMGRLQRQLFPCLEECYVSPLTEQEKHLVKILELIKIESHTAFSRPLIGRPPAERKAIARCIVAKAVFRYQHTRSLIHELKARPNHRCICGFARQRDIPSESTFSRVFAEFAANNAWEMGLALAIKDRLSQAWSCYQLASSLDDRSRFLIYRQNRYLTLFRFFLLDPMGKFIDIIDTDS
jgi:hypothetical protein